MYIFECYSLYTPVYIHMIRHSIRHFGWAIPYPAMCASGTRILHSGPISHNNVPEPRITQRVLRPPRGGPRPRARARFDFGFVRFRFLLLRERPLCRVFTNDVRNPCISLDSTLLVKSFRTQHARRI